MYRNRRNSISVLNVLSVVTDSVELTSALIPDSVLRSRPVLNFSVKKIN